MTEDTVLILLGIASVAATFAGFSGVVAVFGRRAHGEWFPEDRFRLTNMLVTSLGSCLLAFVPLLELLLHLHGSSLWVVASILMFAYCAAYIAYAIPHWLHLTKFHPGALSPRVAIVVWVCSIGPALLQIMNALSLLFHREPGPYVLGLLLFLIIAGVQFALLVLRPLTAHRAHPHEKGEADLLARDEIDAPRAR